MALIIRDAAESDFTAVAAINAEVQALHHVWAPTRYPAVVDAQGFMRFFAAALDDRDGGMIVAAHGEQVVGYARLLLRQRPATAFTFAAHVGVIDQIGVAAKHRRQGVGRTLVAAARARLLGAGADWIDASIWTANAASRAMFDAAGFAEIRVTVTSPPPR